MQSVFCSYFYILLKIKQIPYKYGTGVQQNLKKKPITTKLFLEHMHALFNFLTDKIKKKNKLYSYKGLSLANS